MLKVLFWISPVTEMDWPFMKIGWAKSFVPRVISALQSCRGEIDVTSVMSSDLAVRVRAEGFSLPGRAVELTQREVLNDYRFNAVESTKEFLRGFYDADAHGHFIGLLHDRLGAEYAPDVVVSLGHAPFMREAYPHARIFFHEVSVFSRSPYPMTFAFDPFGQSSGFTVARHAGEISRAPVSPEECEALGKFRASVIGALSGNAAISEYFADLRKSFSRILLLPLGYENSTDTLVNQTYHSQFEMVEHVLDCVSSDTCVCLTQHPIIPAITAQRIRELMQIHPNLRHETWYARVPCFSQVALAYVDACAYDCTSLAYQAAFLGVPSVSLGGFCEGLADKIGYERIEDVFDCPRVPHDNFMAWVLKNYAFAVEDMPLQLSRYLESDFAKAAKCTDVLSIWPNVLSAEELISRLRRWEDTCVGKFAVDLAALDIVQMSGIADQLKESNHVRGVLWKRLQEAEKICEERKTRLDASEKMRGELWSRLQKSQDECAGVKRKLQESQEVRSVIWKRLQGAEETVAKLKSSLDESQDVRRKIWGRLTAAESDLEVLKKRFAEESKRLANAQDGLARAAERQTALESALKKSTAALERSIADLEREASCRKASDATVARQERELASLERRYSKEKALRLKVERSWSYRLGLLLTFPFRLFESSHQDED